MHSWLLATKVFRYRTMPSGVRDLPLFGTRRATLSDLRVRLMK